MEVNIHNSGTQRSEDSFFVREHERDSPKVKVWCALPSDFAIRPFILVEETVHTDML
jgi:hypothetical protein